MLFLQLQQTAASAKKAGRDQVPPGVRGALAVSTGADGAAGQEMSGDLSITPQAAAGIIGVSLLPSFFCNF